MKKTLNILDAIGLNNYKIHTKLLIMVVLTCLLPIALLSWLNISHSSNEIRNEIFKGNQLYTTLTNERINQYFSAREGDAAILAASQTISGGIGKLNSYSMGDTETQAILENFKNYLDIPIQRYGYTDIFLTNMYGEVVFSKNYDKLDIAPLVFSGDFCEKAMAGGQNWSEMFRNSFINDNIMVLATPVYAEQGGGAPIGALNIVLNQAAVNDIVQNGIDKLGKTADSYIIDQSGLLLTNPMKAPKKSRTQVSSLWT